MPDDIFRRRENEYVTDWNDPNYARSLFGLEQEPTVLTSQESIDVRAPLPDNREPYPSDMSSIYLGTRNAPPTGTYTPSAPVGRPNVDPRARAAWQELIRNHPFAERFISDVGVRDLGPGTYGVYNGNRNVTLSPNALDSPTTAYRVLAHEATHAAQDEQFPKGAGNEGKSFYGKDGIWGDYKERPGENAAFKVAADAESIRNKNTLQEARRRIEDEYLAGKGPLPYWIKSRAELLSKRAK